MGSLAERLGASGTLLGVLLVAMGLASIFVSLAFITENMRALVANVGTTITALLASLDTSRPEALTIALVHTLFNVSGIVASIGIIFVAIPAIGVTQLR